MTRQPKIRMAIRNSPSPSLAENHFQALLEVGGANAIAKIPAAQLPALFYLLGSSTYLSDVLIRQGKQWPEMFLAQIRIARRTVSEHLADLALSMKNLKSLDDSCAALRQYKQREYLRIGSRALPPSVPLEDTVRELSALADGSLEAAYFLRTPRGDVFRTATALR